MWFHLLNLLFPRALAPFNAVAMECATQQVSVAIALKDGLVEIVLKNLVLWEDRGFLIQNRMMLLTSTMWSVLIWVFAIKHQASANAVQDSMEKHANIWLVEVHMIILAMDMGDA